ncbi:hypothetical protein JHK82_053381 [Glycine max]|nr:hypothetical protein JHK82_053381 [Glycine max]
MKDPENIITKAKTYKKKTGTPIPARDEDVKPKTIWWFMSVNILGTFILVSTLGWILIKMTRPPKHMEGLILGCCSAGMNSSAQIIE